MHVHVTKWGNSLGVRIPRVLAHKIGLHEGSPVNVSIQDHHIVITKELSLQSLLDQITPENTHQELEVGPAHGKETW